ncbi:MAG: UbiA family prenyltransferase [Taibaiella sp.]|nr:UbiA family prenyltransferase [Taibaiella sp.]
MNIKRKQNEYTLSSEQHASFLKRFWIYQKERFPFMGHGLLVAAFSFSAVSYSRICRGEPGFVEWKTFLVGIFTTISLFLLVRIFDEFKDAADDERYRRELPVPRGLVSLKELRDLGIILVIFQITINWIFFPKMLLLYGIAVGYLCLMGKEFFISEWLKKHQFWYVVSHMFIIPLIDIYASGLDWLLKGVPAPPGLLFFFAVSFMSGIVLEIGRKIRIPEDEQAGVLTYSAMHGDRKATLLWILMLFLSFVFSIAASGYAGYGNTGWIVLTVLFIISAVPAMLYLNRAGRKRAKMIEAFSGLWAISMYLTLGGVPMLERLVGS